MLQPDIVDINNSSISNLICKIDERLMIFGKNKWLSLSFDIDKYYNKEVVELLIYYKKFLQKRQLNYKYASCIKHDDIVSRINILLNK